MDSHFSLLNFAGTGADIASGGTTSFHLQPKVAATDGHKRLCFSGMSESGGVPSWTNRRSVASGEFSSASKRSDFIPEEPSVANAGSGVSTSSPNHGIFV
jgi:hypothetical protein